MLRLRTAALPGPEEWCFSAGSYRNWTQDINKDNMKKNRHKLIFIIIITCVFLIGCFSGYDDSSSEGGWRQPGDLMLRGFVNIQTPSQIAISPDGKYIYCVSGGGGIYWYTRNMSTGCLSRDLTNDFYNSGITGWMVMSPDGAYVYAAIQAGPAILCFKRDPDTGHLSKFPITITTAMPVTYMIMAPDGKHIYVSDGTKISWYSRNIYTGAITLQTATYPLTVMPMSELAFSPESTNLYMTSMQTVYWFKRNTVTGNLNIDLTTDKYTVAGASYWGIAVSPNGKYVYATSNGGSSEIALFKRNISTGVLSGHVSTAFNMSNSIVLTTDMSNAYCIANPTKLTKYFIDPNTGALMNNLDYSEPALMNMPQKLIISPDRKNLYLAAMNGGSTGTGGIIIFTRSNL
jgi:6-phosphogluconolactonase (cycloisomerase 2 family)